MHVNETVGTATGSPLTFATQVQKRGYATGYFGKYLNKGGMDQLCEKKQGGDKPAGSALMMPEGGSEGDRVRMR